MENNQERTATVKVKKILQSGDSKEWFLLVVDGNGEAIEIKFTHIVSASIPNTSTC